MLNIQLVKWNRPVGGSVGMCNPDVKNKIKLHNMKSEFKVEVEKLEFLSSKYKHAMSEYDLYKIYEEFLFN